MRSRAGTAPRSVRVSSLSRPVHSISACVMRTTNSVFAIRKTGTPKTSVSNRYRAMSKMPSSTKSGDAKTTLPTNASAASRASRSRTPESISPRPWASTSSRSISRISARFSGV